MTGISMWGRSTLLAGYDGSDLVALADGGFAMLADTTAGNDWLLVFDELGQQRLAIDALADWGAATQLPDGSLALGRTVDPLSASPDVAVDIRSGADFEVIVPYFTEDGPTSALALADVEATRDGGHWVTFVEDSTTDDAVIIHKNLAGGGDQRVTAFLSTTLEVLSADTAVLGNGNLAVVWETRDADSTRSISLRVFTGKGTPLSAEIPLEQSSSMASPVAEALANGNFAVSWRDEIAGGIFHQIFDANGDAVSTRQFYNAGGIPIPRISQLPDGGYVLAWSEYVGIELDNSPETDIFLQRFDAQGRVTGELLVIGGAGDESLNDIETLKDGRIVVTCMSETGDSTDVSNLLYQVIETRGAAIDGSAAADNMVASMSDSTLYGHDGNDRLRGMGGDDALHGQGGADTMNGGAGDDTLSGGLGFDNVNGSQGDDVLRGGSGDDTLGGGVGVDILCGDSGNDRLAGGGGRDVLTGGSGSDVFDFGALSDSGITRGTQDVIKEFFEDEDTIDLSSIDARAGVGGNQAFSFIGSAAFSAEGQVRVVVVGDTTFLMANTTGTGGAEMMIRIAGTVTLDATHLVL